MSAITLPPGAMWRSAARLGVYVRTIQLGPITGLGRSPPTPMSMRWPPVVEMHVVACGRDACGRLWLICLWSRCTRTRCMGTPVVEMHVVEMATCSCTLNSHQHSQSADGQRILWDFDSLVELDEQVRCYDKRFEDMLERLRDGEGLSDEDARILAQRTLGIPPW